MRFIKNTIDGRQMACASVQTDDFGNELALEHDRNAWPRKEEYFDLLIVDYDTYLRIALMDNRVDD